ncbi:hypothetical protein RTH74_11595 [Pseudomonas sp. zfem001]|uniref:hypothetical protein n=1 Tax=Pseudomonas sp. zfem001 TaxID=3078196 RepID=UPI002927BD83|nr:hypothetical protein [Pseudomonas sp. zfem001]MDU9408242.1 hypothetical protein [Pseudomonas sp. zfem001]
MILGLAQMSQAANYPCSGKKGGVARCDGELWVCNDGSISGSKRNCSAVYGGSAKALRATGNAPSECSCGTGVLCTGPRGGQYCITASGNKSYRRK